MKKRLVLGLVMILALACVLVSCNSEVSAENGAGSAKTGSIVIGQEASKAVGYTVSYTDTVEDLYWYYTAAKKDNGYTSGQVTTLTAVSNEKGLQGKTLTNFSYGLWDLNFYGFKQPSDSSNIANAVYTGSVLNFLVHQDVNNATVNLELGNASTEIVFGDIYFTFDHDVHESTFTLAVTDNMGTVTVPTSGVISNEGQTVTFTGLTYAGTTSNISGEHTMVFTLSQVLSGENNITIEAANYTLPFTVTTGTKTTISGDLTQNNQIGDIYINSASLSAAAAVSVSKALSSKVVPVTADSISVDTVTGAGTATVSTNTTISNGDLKVTYPVGAKIAVDGTTTSIDTTTADKKSDAQTGFEYVSDTASNTNISIATTEAVSQYELTINLAEDNEVLAPVEKYIGTGLVITNIYHNSNTPMSNAYVDDETEYWQYNSTTGYLTLYVFHASPFDIVYQKVVAYIGTKSYYSLASAFAAAESGNTITLAMDVPMDSGYSSNKPLVLKQDNVTFDLNGKEITDVSNFSLTMQGENITVKNGKITSGEYTAKTTHINSYVLVLNRCDGVVLDGLTLTGGISVGGSQDDWGSETSQKSSTDITGTVGYAGTSTGVVIKNCDVTSGDYYAICSQMNSQATIKSGTYTANTENSCSTSKVIHGYFVGTDGPQGYITVEGGTFNGSIASSNVGWVVLKGGTYSVNPTSSGCVATGYKATDNGDDTWTVDKEAYVAVYDANNNWFKSYYPADYSTSSNPENAAVQEGFSDAFYYTGYEARLLRDVSVTATIEKNSDKVGKIDLNGHTLTSSASKVFEEKNYNGNDKLIIKNGKITATANSGTTFFLYGDLELTDVDLEFGNTLGIDAYPMQGVGGGKVSMTRGQISGNKTLIVSRGIKAWYESEARKGNVTLDGVNIVSNNPNPDSTYGSICGYGGEITLENCSFSGEGTTRSIKASHPSGNNGTGPSTVTIKGGSYSCSFTLDGDSVIEIKGGTFNVDPSAYVADGYYAEYHLAADPNPEYWTVKEIPADAIFALINDDTKAVVTIINDDNRASITDNGNGIPAKHTLKMLKDYTYTAADAWDLISFKGDSITFDLNGHTFTFTWESNSSVFNANGSTNLTFKDGTITHTDATNTSHAPMLFLSGDVPEEDSFIESSINYYGISYPNAWYNVRQMPVPNN